MRRAYSPIVLMEMGFTMFRQALTAALILVLAVVALQKWGPDVTPMTESIQVKLRQVVTS